MELQEHEHWMHQAIEEAANGLRSHEGGPFGTVIVKDGMIIGKGHNMVTGTNDPTAHAEIVAIRQACVHLKQYHLKGCVLYTTCEPCPMCLSAIYWAHIDKVYYASTRHQAAQIGFDDEHIYKELNLPVSQRSISMQQITSEEALQLFSSWKNDPDKKMY